MKFCKKYLEYMEGKEKEELPVMSLKKMKKTLKRCRRSSCHQRHEEGIASGGGGGGGDAAAGDSKFPDHHCPACDGTFFPSLLNEMSTVVGCFNERAQKLLQLHLASGFRKYFMWFFKGKYFRHNHMHRSLVQQGKDLVTYAILNSVAMRKILKKYDKIHYSKQGLAFRSQVQNMHIEILHSPWLCELMALYINTREDSSNANSSAERVVNLGGLFEDCSLTFDGGKPMLSCGIFDSLQLNIELTCSICLDTVFDPVSLTCGHIFCYMCACRTASVSIVDGLKVADASAKCPLCRQARVYEGSVRLVELNILLRRNCHEYWEQRLHCERVERLQQAKEHWESQCRALLGM